MRDFRGDGPPVMRVPTQPSEEEEQEHLARQRELCAGWCEACVAGRGRGTQHRKHTDAKEEVVVQFDCQCWSEDNTGAMAACQG